MTHRSSRVFGTWRGVVAPRGTFDALRDTWRNLAAIIQRRGRSHGPSGFNLARFSPVPPLFLRNLEAGEEPLLKIVIPDQRALDANHRASSRMSRNIATRERHLELCRDFVSEGLTSHSILVEVGSADAPFDHLPDLVVSRRISLDVDIPALGRAERQRKLVGGSLVAADGHHMPIRRETIDGIVAVFVLEHLPDPRKFLEEARRVLKPGGFVFVVTPNLADPFFFPIRLIPVRLREKLLRVVGGHPEHRYLTYLRANTARRLEALAAQTGLRLSRSALLWENHYLGKLPAGDAILGAIDRWGSGTDLEKFAGRLYALLRK